MFLIDNGLNSMNRPEELTIDLEVVQENEQIRIRVIDRGTGMHRR